MTNKIKTKNYSFIAYIDETGDIGINKDKIGSSEWFGMSAFLVPANRDLELVSIRDSIIKAYSTTKESTKNYKKFIHMKDIKKDETKEFISKKVASIKYCKGIVVLSNKCSISNHPESFKDKEAYYRYMSRLLFERITNCCSEWRKEVKDGNGKVKIIFATRRGMSYEQLKGYLSNLKTSENVNSKIQEQNLPKINWEIVDINSVDNIPAEKRAGLQFADVLAYSFYKAVTKNQFDMVNTRFCKYFKKIMYKNKNRIWHNGVFITNSTELPPNKQPKELQKIFKNPKSFPKQGTARFSDIIQIQKKASP